MQDHILRVTLSDTDIAVIEELVEELFEIQSDTSFEFLLKIKSFSYRLPIFLIDQSIGFKYKELYSVVLFENMPFPRDKEREKTPMAMKELYSTNFSKDEIQMLLIGSLFGDIFTWDSIQSSRLINHVFPVKHNSNMLISSNSNIDFGLHTEDSFHFCAGDYLLLFGYRNPSNIPTTVVYLDAIILDDSLKKELFKKNFIIHPNIAHDLKGYKSEATSILFGNYDKPYIRINLNPKTTTATSAEGQKALEVLHSYIQHNKQYLLIETNQLAIIDNFKTIHGRERYTANFDGLDRWLKRIYLTRDLRKSAHLRKQISDNILMVK